MSDDDLRSLVTSLVASVRPDRSLRPGYLIVGDLAFDATGKPVPPSEARNPWSEAT